MTAQDLSIGTVDAIDIAPGYEVPEMLVNLDRAKQMMTDRGLDGLIVYLRPNVYYFSSYASRATQSMHETNGPAAVIIARDHPEHPVIVLPDWDLPYFLDTPSWIEDRRAYATALLPYGEPADTRAFDRFVPRRVVETAWGARARDMYAESLTTACRAAIEDLGLGSRVVGYDDHRFATQLTRGLDLTLVDAYDAIKFIRQVKTDVEIGLLRGAALLNETALGAVTDAWELGMNWREFMRAYNVRVTELGGFVHDPGAIVIGNGPDEDPAFYMIGRDEQRPLTPGISMMLDCHGTLNGYCWDGGKTWVVDGERTGMAAKIQMAATEALRVVESKLVPGAVLSDAQTAGVNVFRAMGVPDPDRALIFFHGLGLEHLDMEIPLGRSRHDMVLEKNMIVSVHVVYPSGPSERYYIEDNALVQAGGGKSLYSWGVDPF